MNRPLCCFFLLLAAISTHSSTYRCDTTILGADKVVTCSTFSGDGKLLAVDKTKNGALHGIQKEWYNSGQLRSVTPFSDGRLVDTAFACYENGSLKTRAVLNGASITLSKDGDTLTKSPMKNGKPTGISTSYFRNGVKKTRTHHNDSGQKHGLSETWREDGTRKDSIVYDNGDIVEVRRYYNNGKLLYHKKQKPVNKDINAVYYDPKGRECGEVKNGTGTFILYSDDGKSARRFFLKDDEVVKHEEVDPK